MEARSKTIEQWFSMIEQGQIVLPRFQRHQAWRHAQISGLIENVLRKPSLPVGALLILEIGNEEPFHSRPIVGAPESTAKPSMHLLDGQQRMTALWRTLTDDYDDLTIFVSLGPNDDDPNGEEETPKADMPIIERVKRWDRKGVRQPVWADDPVQSLERDLIPAAALRPGAEGERTMEAWLETVEAAGHKTNAVLKRIYELRQRVAGYHVPFLSLGAGTGRETALDVFIKMNTSASPLKDYDIVVAQLEEATGESLHDMMQELLEFEPAAKKYGKVEDIVLSVAALLIGKAPLKKTYLEKDFGAGLAEVWPEVKQGFKKGLAFLRNEAIFNEKSLPTDVAVYLICALWARVPEHGFDAEGNARSLLRKALWRACFTDRYGKTSATRAFADYKSLSKMISNADDEEVRCDLFNEELYPLPEIGELVMAGWPGRKDRLPRALLACSLRAGGYDFADGAPIHPDNIERREYHHLYPVGVLGGDRADEKVNRALNCALITWTTNRKVGAKTPKEYIEKRAQAASLGEAEVRQRLESHRVPYDALVAGDYFEFLQSRAELIHKDILSLCEGSIPE
jgi:hypothetical protein